MYIAHQCDKMISALQCSLLIRLDRFAILKYLQMLKVRYCMRVLYNIYLKDKAIFCNTYTAKTCCFIDLFTIIHYYGFWQYLGQLISKKKQFCLTAQTFKALYIIYRNMNSAIVTIFRLKLYRFIDIQNKAISYVRSMIQQINHIYNCLILKSILIIYNHGIN